MCCYILKQVNLHFLFSHRKSYSHHHDLVRSHGVYFTDDQWYVLFFTFIIPSSFVTLCDKVCQWLATGRWFSQGPPVSFTNKSDRHDISEILLKVTLNTIIITPYSLWLAIGVLKWVIWWLLLVEQEMLNSRGTWVKSQLYVGRVAHS